MGIMLFTSAFLFMILIRNKFVLDESLRILDLINELATDDINNGREWKWRFLKFEEISYEKMLLTFWKPIKSFYKDSDILKPGGR
jgi:hypothetical protein